MTDEQKQDVRIYAAIKILSAAVAHGGLPIYPDLMLDMSKRSMQLADVLIQYAEKEVK